MAGSEEEENINAAQENLIRTAEKKFGSTEEFESVFLIDTVSVREKDDFRVFMTVILEDQKRAVIEVLNFSRCLDFVLKPEADEKEAASELRDLLRMHGVFEYEARFLDMKYIFEIEEIPRDEVRVCEVRYPFGFESRTPSPAARGHTFTYVIGTTYTPTELFVVRNRIKGPQWLRLPKKLLKPRESKSRSVLGFQLTEPECIDAETLRGRPIPPLRVMSISLKTGRFSEIGVERKKDELVIYNLSYVFKEDYKLHSRHNCESFTESQSYYLAELEKPKVTLGGRPTVKAVADENVLLSCLMTRISLLEPDVVVCHDFNCSLDVLTAKLGFYQNDNLKKFGRIYLGDYISGGVGSIKRTGSLLKGRIIVDTMKHAEDSVKSADKKLSTLSSLLGLKPLLELTPDEISKRIECCEFSSVFLHTHQEALNVLGVLSELRVLESTLELANICGYMWQKVIAQNRAERNEYLIMHECYKEQCLIPDKFFYHEEGYDGKYEGGMVLEPRKGLHQGFVVVLDFLSLYPSIIREYNICFSKVKRNLFPIGHYVRTGKDEEEERNELFVVPPEMEFCTEENWGLLPRLIHMLVSERERYK